MDRSNRKNQVSIILTCDKDFSDYKHYVRAMTLVLEEYLRPGKNIKLEVCSSEKTLRLYSFEYANITSDYMKNKNMFIKVNTVNLQTALKRLLDNRVDAVVYMGGGEDRICKAAEQMEIPIKRFNYKKRG